MLLRIEVIRLKKYLKIRGSGEGYTLDNIQWVHKMVNMCKNKYLEQEFIHMCIAILETVKSR